MRDSIEIPGTEVICKVVDAASKSTDRIQFPHGEMPCPDLCKAALGVRLPESILDKIHQLANHLKPSEWLEVGFR